MTTANTSLAQARLRESRNEFRSLLTESQSSDQFPRSATMQWLMSGAGQGLIGYIAGGSMSRLVPRIWGVLRVMPMGLLIKKFWPKMNRG